MPANSPTLAPLAADALAAIGEAIRARRKTLGISAVAAAEAAGISRVTLHRIEKGAPAVTSGAYMAACRVLGLEMQVIPKEAASDGPQEQSTKGWMPTRVRIADYPVLKSLAWQLHGTDDLSPGEALGIYERNQRHVDDAALSVKERDLLEALRQVLGNATGV
jgi:transcriptional regulator with XRE-family HTH domain